MINGINVPASVSRCIVADKLLKIRIHFVKHFPVLNKTDMAWLHISAARCFLCRLHEQVKLFVRNLLFFV